MDGNFANILPVELCVKRHAVWYERERTMAKLDGLSLDVYSLKQAVSMRKERKEKKERLTDGDTDGDPRLPNVFIVDANFLRLSEAR